ncbi:MAG: hypothetical protein ABT940_12865, partial [Alphaproteobacteria bacterium]
MSHLVSMLSGAGARLLPFWVPYRFFVAAVIFHVAAWGLLAMSAEPMAGFRGGAGSLLTAIHALTLGVFTTTVIGASLQILPVATGQPLASVRLARVVSWMYLPGVVVLLAGFHQGLVLLMAVGGGLVFLGLAIFGGLVVEILRRADHILPTLQAYVRLSLLSLALVVTLGLLAVADFGLGLLPDHPAVALTHFLLAAFGFMGCLVLGYSHILVPMFALSASPPTSRWEVWLTATALGLAASGALLGWPGLLLAATAVGLGVVGIYLRAMRICLKSGMRKNLGLSFVLVRASWGLLPLALLTGAGAAIFPDVDRLLTLFVFLTLFGWLLTFLVGILQRIIPFLAAMNASKGSMPRLSALADDAPLQVHAVCHLIALALV